MFELIKSVGPSVFCGNALFFLIGGYDTSNIANIQVPIYNAFGGIEMLPWVSLAYALTGVAFVPVARKLLGVYEPRRLGIFGSILSMLGSFLAGFAKNIEMVIFGRVVMAMGSVILYQIVLQYNAEKAPEGDFAKVQALTGIFFPLGLFLGPLIGGAFAQAEHATWRWAFFIAIPILAIATILLATCYGELPHQSKDILTETKRRSDRNRSNLKQFRKKTLTNPELIGILSWISIFVLFGLCCTFSGSVWAWKSASTIAVWILLGVVSAIFVAYVFSQQKKIRSREEHETALPIRIANQYPVILPELCVFFASVGYGTTLYYTPIYFAFAHGDGAFDAAKHLLPFIGVFIVAMLASGYLVKTMTTSHQPLLLVVGAVLLTIGAGLQQKIAVGASINSVMGYEAIVGAGVGLMWQTGLAMSSGALESGKSRKTGREGMDVIALHNMAQMGGVAVGVGIAGTVYQNVGAKLLQSLVSARDTYDHDLRELLAGANSAFLLAYPELYTDVLEAITKTIRQCFYINIAAGALCFAASILSLLYAYKHKY